METAANLTQALEADSFVAVRRRIFRQLVESLIYEGVVQPEIEPDGGGLRFSLHGQDEHGRPVTYHCRGTECFSFDRLRLTGPIVRVAAGTPPAEAGSLAQFLVELRDSLGGETERLVRFSKELEQTLLNDAVAQDHRRRAAQVLRDHPYDRVEAELPDGHPYHPSYKSRLGFDPVDNLTFGPEFHPTLRPIWLAVHRAFTALRASRTIDPAGFMARELGQASLDKFHETIRRRGGRPADFVLLPVHPWQWRERIASTFYHDLREGQVILLGQATDAYTPQQSIRTLANRTDPRRACLKLSLDIVNTSTSRILAPHTVQNAPAITDWLKGIVQTDPYLRDELRLILLGEFMGVSYDRAQPELLQPATYGMLSCIWRESLHPFLDSDDGAVPFNALCHLDLDGRPFIDPWLRHHGIVPWLRRLLEVAIRPIIHLLYAHGIAMEAHAQNMVLVHKQGFPQRLALRDFHDGIRFSPHDLAAPEQQPALLPTPPAHARINRNSYIESDDPEDVRDFMHDAFFFVNLSELALFLAEWYGLEERRFWGVAREVIEAYQQRFDGLQPRFDRFDLFAPTIQVEQLTKRRLYPDTEVRVHRVRNALHAVEEEVVS